MLRDTKPLDPVAANDIAPSTCGLVAIIGDAPHAWTMVNALRKTYGDFPVIVEKGEPASKFWKTRTKKLGIGTVLSQKAALALAKISKPLSRNRLQELEAECDTTPIPHHLRVDVDTINNPKVARALKAINPTAIFVASTGILRGPLLNAINCPVVNYHSGINPAYRGINGGYFARANRDEACFGVTLHLIDKGIDTGPILATNRVRVTSRDNMQTYMALMAAKSQDLVVKTMDRVLKGDDKPQLARDPRSKQYYAPTLGQYLRNGFLRGVW